MRDLRFRLKRLARLERRCPLAPELYLAFVNDQRCVLGGQSSAVRPWIGRHHGELPGPVKIILGVDPLQALGRMTGGVA